MKRLAKIIRSVVWTSALAVVLIISGIVATVLGDTMLGLVLSVGAVAMALLATKE